MTAVIRTVVMSSPSQNGSPLNPASSDDVPTSKRHVADAAVADAFIRAVRACTPGEPARATMLRWAVVDYVDAARARGDTHERTICAVRHMITTLVLSPAWCGIHRAEARDIIRDVVALASVRFYSASAYREAQPSTAFHFEVRADGDRPLPLTRHGWDEESAREG